MINNLDTLLVLTTPLLFFLWQTIENTSFLSYISGKLVSKPFQGVSLYHSYYAFGRIFYPLVIIIISYLVETTLQLGDYLILAISMSVFALIGAAYSIRKVDSIQKYFQRVIIEREKYSLPKAIFSSVFLKNITTTSINFDLNLEFFKKGNIIKILTACFAYFLINFSFLFGFLLAYLFPELRMTMSQLAVFFLGFGAIVVALYIDPMISKSLDNELANDLWLINLKTILYGRLLSYILAVSIFLILFSTMKS